MWAAFKEKSAPNIIREMVDKSDMGNPERTMHPSYSTFCGPVNWRRKSIPRN